MKKIILAAALLAGLGGYAQKVSNKLSFQKGQKLEITRESKLVSTQEFMGQSMETTINSTTTEVLDVEEVDSKGATLEHKVKRMQFTADAMGQTQSFDSEKEGDRKGELGKLMEKSLKNKYTIILDPTGRITRVKKDDDNPNASDSLAVDTESPMAAMLGLSLAVPDSGSAHEFRILPDHAVGKGDSWVDSASGNGQKRKTTYTVANITDSEIQLDFTEENSLQHTQEIMDMEATISSRGKATGKVILDRRTGLLKQKTSEVASEGKVEAGGQVVPTMQKATVMITVKQG